MRLTTSRLVCLLACLAIAMPLLAQMPADPLTGTWVGDWGPSASDRNQVSVDMKWDGKALTGVVKTVGAQRPDVQLQKSTYDAAKGTVHMEADAPGRGGATVHFVIEGKVTNNTMTGTWGHDSLKGDFKLTKK